MKIKTSEEMFIIPASSGLNLLYEIPKQKKLKEYLSYYFGQKKKTKCIVLDEEDDDNLISPADAEWVHFGTKDLVSEFDFKQKTNMNIEISEMIEKNPKMFESIENVRDSLKSLLTDRGMFRLKKILTSGMDVDLEMNISNFDTSKIIENLHLEHDSLSDTECLIILYNLALYLNRNKFVIIYIDFKVDDTVLKWLHSIKDENKLILVENECIDSNQADEFDSLIVLNNTEMVEKLEFPLSYASSVSYFFHSVVIEHPEYQNDKILEFYDVFQGFEETFFAEFINDKALKSL